MRRVLLPALAGLCVLGATGGASAMAVAYTSEAAFAAATGATLHALPTGAGGSPLIAGSITSTDGVITLNTASGSLISNWEAQPGVGVSRLGGPDLAISGPESFDVAVQFGADRYAFGFGIYESTDDSLPGCNFACTESTFTITLWNDGVQLSPSYLLSPANDIAVFWGLQTDFAFDAIKIRETTGSADNEIFGTFYSGTARAVPEPGGLALAGLALAGLGLARRRR